ncbi:hypothetical protein Tco_0010364 [Tanacetum coccineum]
MDKTWVMEDESLLTQKHLFITTTTDKHGVPPTKRLFKVAYACDSPNSNVLGKFGDRLTSFGWHVEKESPKTEKSSMNTSIVFLIMSWKIAIVNRNLKITREAIEETIVLVSHESFEHLIHDGQWEMVFSGGFIQLSIVNAHSPPYDQSSWYQIIIIILNDGYTTLLWYTMYRAYPWTVRDRIN